MSKFSIHYKFTTLRPSDDQPNHAHPSSYENHNNYKSNEHDQQQPSKIQHQHHGFENFKRNFYIKKLIRKLFLVLFDEVSPAITSDARRAWNKLGSPEKLPYLSASRFNPDYLAGECLVDMTNSSGRILDSATITIDRDLLPAIDSDIHEQMSSSMSSSSLSSTPSTKSVKRIRYSVPKRRRRAIVRTRQILRQFI